MANGIKSGESRDSKLLRDSKLTFFQGFLRKPQQVGSVIPSSRFLERRILKLADIGEDDTVVELGPGTGGTTRAILNELGPKGRLLSIEIEPDFIDLLQEIKDPRFIIHHGSALDISEILEQHRLGDPDIVISGIPFSTMSNKLGSEIVQAIHSALKPGKVFVAYQLRDRVAELSTPIFGRPEISLELINIPPMRVYKWARKKDSNPLSEIA